MNSNLVRGTVVGAGLLVAAYPLFLRRACLTWGATDEEVRRPLPGDDLLPLPDMLSTRAVTVDAPPSAIWPWLVQMGSGRGGAYTYDWIENLFGLQMHSADEILPEFQNVKVGDVLPVGPDGPGLTMEVLDPDRSMVLRSEDRTWVWIFALFPEADGTRLISRNRIWTPHMSRLGRYANALLMEPGSLVMERKMLHGIKARAEGTASGGTAAADGPPDVGRAATTPTVTTAVPAADPGAFRE